MLCITIILRFGIFINIAEQLLEEEKKKAQSMSELMKNPTKVVLLQVRYLCPKYTRKCHCLHV